MLANYEIAVGDYFTIGDPQGTLQANHPYTIVAMGQHETLSIRIDQLSTMMINSQSCLPRLRVFSSRGLPKIPTKKRSHPLEIGHQQKYRKTRSRLIVPNSASSLVEYPIGIGDYFMIGRDSLQLPQLSVCETYQVVGQSSMWWRVEKSTPQSEPSHLIPKCISLPELQVRHPTKYIHSARYYQRHA